MSLSVLTRLDYNFIGMIVFSDDILYNKLKTVTFQGGEMKQSKSAMIASGLLLSLILSACGSPEPEEEPDLQATLAAMYAEETAQAMAAEPPTQPVADQAAEAPEEEAVPSHMEWLQPGDPPEKLDRTLEDSKSNTTAGEKKATQGDLFLNNLYERPFTSEEMIYQPDLDITTVDFGPGEGFYYFTIRLYGMNVQGGGLQGMYSIEFDRTLTGRGDLLVTVKNPAKEWSTEGVVIYLDDNRDVGGPQPIVADAGFSGSGYETVFEIDADRNAFARIDPTDGNAVQIAVSFPLVGGVDQFLWGAWADNGLMDPTKFDYNDTMGPTAAGSPILGNYYPAKALYNLDNTCRLPFGLEQTGLVPGMCKIGVMSETCECKQWYTYYFGNQAVRVCIDKVCK